MTPIRLLTAAAFSALLAGSAVAQTPAQPVDDSMPAAPETATTTPPVTAPTDTMPAAPAAEQSATPASGVVLQSSPTPPEQAYTLKAGDPSVVSNGPVPDTAENRAKYGAPMSNGGKRTKPAGN